MRRRTRLLALSGVVVVLGVITSGAVAWGIALARGEAIGGTAKSILVAKPLALVKLNENGAVGRRSRFILAESVSKSAAPEKVEAASAKWRDEVAAGAAHAWPDTWLDWGDLERDAEMLARRRQYAFGFPVVCLWYERSGGLSMFGSAMRVHGGYEITKALGRERSGFTAEAALPWRPVWVGLVVNSVVYAGAWAGVVALWARWRAARWRRAGLCPGCRYDLRGIKAGAVCPECGGEVGGNDP